MTNSFRLARQICKYLVVERRQLILRPQLPLRVLACRTPLYMC